MPPPTITVGNEGAPTLQSHRYWQTSPFAENNEQHLFQLTLSLVSRKPRLLRRLGIPQVRVPSTRPCSRKDRRRRWLGLL